MILTDKCHNCQRKLTIRGINPNRRHPRFCQRAACRKAYEIIKINARTGIVASEVRCKNCGDQIRRGTTYCGKKACVMAKQRSYRRSNATEHTLFGRWVDARNTVCTECRFFNHCSVRVKYGIPVSCENWDKRDMELLEINPNKSSIINLLEAGLVV